MAKKKKNIFLKIVLWFLLIVILAGGTAAYFAYRMFYLPNTTSEIKKSEIIFIPSGSNFENVLDTLRRNKILKNEKSFIWLAGIKKYKDKVKPGRYRILEKMSDNQIINMLRAGLQEPINLTFTNLRTKEELVSRVSKKIEAN